MGKELKVRWAKVRWAIDAFSNPDDTWPKITRAIGTFSNGGPIQLTPTCLLGSNMLGWFKTLEDDKVSEINQNAKRYVEESLKKYNLPEGSDCEFLSCESHSQSTDVDYFSDFLNNDGADLVALGTHSRTGLKRAFMGSFAESLLLRSRVPLLFLSPNMKNLNQLDNVLFPTDFSQASLFALEDLLSRFGDRFKNLTLYSKCMYPVENFAQLRFLDKSLSVEELLEDIHKKRLEESKKWMQLEDKYSIKINCIIEQELDNLVDDILALSEENNTDLILMPSFVSDLDVFFSGSLARELIRHSEIPILVKHFFSEATQ